MMKEGVVKATLYDSNDTIKEWEQFCQGDLPGLLEAIKHVKQSINDYLTSMISSEKDSNLKDSSDVTEHFEVDEEVESDSISEFIKNMNIVKRNEKRKSNSSNQAKKIRK